MSSGHNTDIHMWSPTRCVMHASRAPQFSRGIRQRLKAAAGAGGWREKHAIRVDNHNEDSDQSYTSLLASSVFCFVLPGKTGKWHVSPAGVQPVTRRSGIIAAVLLRPAAWHEQRQRMHGPADTVSLIPCRQMLLPAPAASASHCGCMSQDTSRMVAYPST
jgi:hypothetical protein